MTADAVERILASKLFDPDYYRRVYGHCFAPGQEPARHFIDQGLARGHLPSEDFDPVLYRMFTEGCGSANPLVHFLESGAEFCPPALRNLFPEVADRLLPKDRSAQENAQENRVYADDAANERVFPFTARGRAYALRVPDPDALLNRLRNDRAFAFARLPHGFWDTLWMVDVALTAVTRHEKSFRLNDEERRALALRVCAAIRRGNGAFAPGFIEEVLTDIPLHAGNPDFLRAVSFTGYPTYDGDVVGSSPLVPRGAVLDAFAAHFRPDEILHDATQWKRMLIAGYLEELPGLCRDRPVVLVASDLFATLGERWRLKDCTHVEIPRSLSQWQRWNLLERTSGAVAAACDRSSRPPVVLTQCGGSLAYWLITRLFAARPGVFYLDLGQALNGWFFDVRDYSKSPWVRVYAKSVMDNNGLELYYRGLLGEKFESWLAGLLRPGEEPGVGQGDPRQHENVAPIRTGSLTGRDVLDVEALRSADPETAQNATFSIINKELRGKEAGQLKVPGFGVFHVRQVEQPGGRGTRKVIRFVPARDDTENPG